MTVEAYPLHWPKDRKRNQYPVDGPFSTDLSKASTELIKEIRLLGGTMPIISSNMQLRADGMPYARQSNIEDTGVAVYFTLNGGQMCFACDKFYKLADNVQAIRKTIEALRGIERWGSSDMMERAFTGFLSLPAPGQTTPRSWREVLALEPHETTLEDARRAYRTLAGIFHPDRGGNADAMAELNHAWAQAQEALE